MKRIFLIIALLASALFTLGYFFYSSENVKPTESDLAKYPELSPFLAGRTGFRGINFNLDSNYYSFAFPTHFDKEEVYFGAVDLPATKEGWRLVNSEPRTRVYTREVKAPTAPVQLEKVTLFYDLGKQEVTLIREDGS